MTRLNLVRACTCLYALFIAGVVVSAGRGWNRSAFIWVKGIANDKVLHFVLVGTLAFLLNLSLRSRTVRSGTPWLQLGTLIVLLIATVEEASQLMVTNRTFDLVDLSCNYLGIIVLGSCSLLFTRQ